MSVDTVLWPEKNLVSCGPFVLIHQNFEKCCMQMRLRTHQGIITFVYTYSYNTKLLENISVHPLFADRINRTLVSLGRCQ